MKMATLHDVARESGVSIATISNVFTKKKYVSLETKQKILEICRKLDYKPDPIAASMITKKTGIIGLFLDTKKDVFHVIYSYLIKGVGMEAAHIGYSPLMFFNISEKEDLSKLFSKKTAFIEGAIILAPHGGDFRIKELLKDNIPLVVIGNPPEDIDADIPYLDSPNEQDTYTLTSHLLSKGHRRIAFLNSPKSMTVGKDRLKGFMRAFKEYAAEPDRNLMFEISSHEEAYGVLNKINASFTACMVESDNSAREVYKFAADKNLEIGVNFAVVSLGGLREEFMPSLTSIYVDFEEVGINAVRLLKNVFDKNISSKFIEDKSYITIGASSDFIFEE